MNFRDFLKNIFCDIELLNTNRILSILFLSGFFGFCMGIFICPSWQDGVEPSQVISGLVQYPAGNPVYIYSLKTWTIIHQICALFLRLGFSERALSVFLSGIIGMFSYQALSLSVLSLSRNALFSFIAPFFIQYTGIFAGGVTYPILLMESSLTYALIWLPYILLIVALISLKEYKIGGLLFGLLPAVHLSSGLWFTVIFILCFVWGRRYAGDILRQMARYIIIGYLISFTSLAIHLFLLSKYNLHHIDQYTASNYLSAFLNHWDGHRIKFSAFKLLQVMPGFFISLLWLFFWKDDVPEDSIFFLRCCVISVIIGLCFSIVYWLPAKQVPYILLMMMPSRVLNFSVAVSVILFLGLLWRYNSYLCQSIFVISAISSYPKDSYLVVFLVLLFAVIVALRKYLLSILYTIMLAAGIFCILRILLDIKATLLIRYFFTPALILAVYLFRLKTKSFFNNKSVVVPLKRVTLIMLCVSVLLLGKEAIHGAIAKTYTLADEFNDKFFFEAGKGKGIILTSSNLKLIQLRTRRPVLLDGGSLDALTYVPEIGPEMNRILQEVYGIDIFNPPEETKRIGALAKETGKALWESRTPLQWLVISKEFGFTNILSYADWKLQLPEVIHNKNFILYSIPNQNN